MRLATLFVCCLMSVIATAAEPPFALTGVNVINMESERVLTNQTLIVREGRIVELGSASDIKLPADMRRINARGKYVVPGLAEMHGHLAGPDIAMNERILALNALHGITTLRVMQGHASHLELRERVRRAEVLGPHLYLAAPELSGRTAPDEATAIAAVKRAREQGFDLLKIQEGLSRPVFDAIARTAAEVGIGFAGHVPAAVGVPRALEVKYRSIDHLDGYIEALTPASANIDVNNVGVFGSAIIDLVDEARLPALVRATKAAGTAIVPTETLAVNFLSPTPIETLFARPELKYLPADTLEGWKQTKSRIAGQSASMTPAQRERYFALRRKLIKALYDAGVPVLLGSDAPQVLNVPGVATHDELELMVRAGLTPYQALASGSRDVATHLGTSQDSGTLQVGKRVDLLVLDANPLQDIRNTRKRFGVVVNGRWWAREELDRRVQAFLQ